MKAKSFKSILVTLPAVLLWPLRLLIHSGPNIFIKMLFSGLIIFLIYQFLKKPHPKTALLSVIVLTLIFSHAFTTNSLPRHVLENREKITNASSPYPSVFLGRFYHNKISLMIGKYESNLFDLLDPNYYFFGSHPREIPDGFNYIKFPILAILLISFGLMGLKKDSHVLLATLALFTLFVTLSFTSSIRNIDFFTYFFFVFLIYRGAKALLDEKKLSLNLILSLGLFLSLFEYLRL